MLLAELREVLAREKFRRWLSVEDAAAFVDDVVLLANPIDDPPDEAWARVCAAIPTTIIWWLWRRPMT